MSNPKYRPGFLKDFYGEEFYREFGQGFNSYREPCTSYKDLEKKIIVNELLRRSCVASIYNYCNNHPITPKKEGYVRNYEKYAVIDRICFDLDRSLPIKTNKAIKKAKAEHYHNNIPEAFNILLNEGKWALPPIIEAKRVAQFIKEKHDKKTLIVFSGAKGAHIYLFFKPVLLKHPAEVIRRFQEKLRDYLQLKYVDNQIMGDVARLLRIPYTKHQDSGLKAIPFHIESEYQEIISMASKTNLKPINFDLNDYLIPIEHLLMEIDREVDKKARELKYTHEINKKFEFKYSKDGKGLISIKKLEDSYKLLDFPCFQSKTHYTGDRGHSQRWAIGNILFWSGLKFIDIVNFFKVLVNDFDEKITTHQLKHMLGEDGLPKYVITCEYMKKRGLCNKCGKKFYSKLNLRPEYWNKLTKLVNYNGYKN